MPTSIGTSSIRGFTSGSTCVLLALALGVVTACGREGPTSVAIDTIPRLPDTVGVPVPTQPVGSGTIDIYDRLSPSSMPGSSRYIVYGNGTFVLEWLRDGWVQSWIRGTYTTIDSVLALSFSSTDGSWRASALVQGDSLTVKYDAGMLAAGFEDGLYRAPPESAMDPVTAVYIANADGSGVVRLATGRQPSWSPDETQLVFATARHIYAVSADGSTIRRLGVGHSPAWSPDGRRIAFVNRTGIALMNADGTAVTTLIRHDFREDTYDEWDMGVSSPEWSPDGNRIAFAYDGDGDTEPGKIYVINADGSNMHPLTPHTTPTAAFEVDPSWSPDGSRIVFSSYGYGLASADAKGGAPVSIEVGALRFVWAPDWSPDGSSLLVMGPSPSSEKGVGLWILPSSGGQPRLFQDGAWDGAWSPTGGRVAFTRPE